jgi:adenylate cyclase
MRFTVFILAAVLWCLFASAHCATSRPILSSMSANSKQSQPGLFHRAVQTLESRLQDLFFQIRKERPGHPDVVLVELDEKGAQRFGLWPWPRDVMAHIIEKLALQKPSVIALDVAFVDEEKVNEHEQKLVAQLTQLHLPEVDRVIFSPFTMPAIQTALCAQGSSLVQSVLPLSTSDRGQFTPSQLDTFSATLKETVVREIPGDVKGSVRTLTPEHTISYSIYSAQTQVQSLTACHNRVGHLATVTDLDGVYRRTPLVAMLEQPAGLLYSLSLQAAAAHLGAQIAPLFSHEDQNDVLVAVDLTSPTRTLRIPVEAELPMTRINFPGGMDSFARVSAVDILDGTSKLNLTNKILILGVTVVGSSGDQRVTPFRDFAPGVLTHASVISNILSQDFLNRTPSMRMWELLLLAVTLLAAAFTEKVQNFPLKILILVGVIAVWPILAAALFQRGLIMLSVVPTAALVFMGFAVLFLGYFTSDRRALELKHIFSRYLGGDVLEAALENPERLNRGEKREMTILFSDIRGFTAIAERMSPEELAAFMKEYLSPMTRAVFKHKGTLDKYIGDAVMAFWNAPLDQKDHSVLACRTALEMLARLDELQIQWNKRNLPAIEIGIGINTGFCVVGNLGSDVRVEYTVLGDTVNLASRLENLNKEHQTRIIVGERTVNLACHEFEFRSMGQAVVKGKSEAVKIFELVGLLRKEPPQIRG